jgi:hypothetical protein
MRRFTSVVVCCLGLVGCASPRASQNPSSESQPRGNVFTWSPILPADLRRVVVLPLTYAGSDFEGTQGRDALDPIVQAELIKTERFEVVRVSPEMLREKTGKDGWRADETLPFDLFEWLRVGFSAEAVFFSELTVYHSGPPVAVGWRMQLVDLRSRCTLWATDEFLNSKDYSSQNQAEKLMRQLLTPSNPGPDDWVLRNSPRRFGQFTAAKVLTTLPLP